MIVLGFDTATPATAVGLRLADGRTLQARDDPSGGGRPGHATRLLPLASELLVEAGLGWSEVERIAVGAGPGTFTGLRIGIATARGLAQSLDVEIVGVSSLRALAYGLGDHAPEPIAVAEAPVGVGRSTRTLDEGARGSDARVLAVIDARRGEIFVAAYDGEREVLAPHAVSPDGLGGLLEGAAIDMGAGEWIALGDGAVLYREALRRFGATVAEDCSEHHRIQARAICALGERARAGEAAVVPDYCRRPDAEIALEGAAS
jgi:tRNA threonylcarbamoyladenosine biosynthesis protein TsaB